jgi:ATP citrate (pro-S)-lyase
VELLQKYARKFFPSTRYLDYALTVEHYTLTKAANLVLNVDGCIGALFLDLLHSSSMFSQVHTLVQAFELLLSVCLVVSCTLGAK